MVKELMHDPIFLAGKAEVSTKEDLPVAQDLLDMLMAHKKSCVGMAANMIGVLKNIIIVADGPRHLIMVNPTITEKTGKFETEEGCLSIPGIRPCTRYKNITVAYMDENFKKQRKRFSGWTAQIIQHEIDHCNGVLI